LAESGRFGKPTLPETRGPFLGLRTNSKQTATYSVTPELLELLKLLASLPPGLQ
jgi:hypothetical protein